MIPIIHVCSFSAGCFNVKSKSGKRGVDFEDSDRFGPMFTSMKTGDLSEIPERHWFWSFYTPWREAGRPTMGAPRSTPNGPIATAVWTEEPTNDRP